MINSDINIIFSVSQTNVSNVMTVSATVMTTMSKTTSNNTIIQENNSSMADIVESRPVYDDDMKKANNNRLRNNSSSSSTSSSSSGTNYSSSSNDSGNNCDNCNTDKKTNLKTNYNKIVKNDLNDKNNDDKMTDNNAVAFDSNKTVSDMNVCATTVTPLDANLRMENVPKITLVLTLAPPSPAAVSVRGKDLNLCYLNYMSKRKGAVDEEQQDGGEVNILRNTKTTTAAVTTNNNGGRRQSSTTKMPKKDRTTPSDKTTCLTKRKVDNTFLVEPPSKRIQMCSTATSTIPITGTADKTRYTKWKRHMFKRLATTQSDNQIFENPENSERESPTRLATSSRKTDENPLSWLSSPARRVRATTIANGSR